MRTCRCPSSPYQVYVGIPGSRFNRALAPFPVRKQFKNGRPMPQWKDLTSWLKMQLAVMFLDQWQFQTFNIHIHRDLESKWVGEGRDVRVMMRDRLRRELDDCVRLGLEHFFVIEGWSKRAKGPTLLHIHGGAAIYPDEPTDAANIMSAAGRAAGHGLKGFAKQSRAEHGREFTRDGPRYINYLFKSVRRKDDRLNDRRVTMSRSVVKSTREFWQAITGQGDS